MKCHANNYKSLTTIDESPDFDKRDRYCAYLQISPTFAVHLRVVSPCSSLLTRAVGSCGRGIVARDRDRTGQRLSVLCARSVLRSMLLGGHTELRSSELRGGNQSFVWYPLRRPHGW